MDAFLSDNFRKAFHHLLPACCHRAGNGIGNGQESFSVYFCGSASINKISSNHMQDGNRKLQYQLTTKRR